MLIKLNAFENIEEKENIKSAFLDSRDAKFDKKRELAKLQFLVITLPSS
jgi:hypothetical protein